MASLQTKPHVHTHVGRQGHTLAVSAVCAMRSSCFLVSDKTPKNPIFTSSDLCVCVFPGKSGLFWEQISFWIRGSLRRFGCLGKILAL